MTLSTIITHRLFNQQISNQAYSKPEELLSYLCAVQGQDYGQAKWAIGLRLPNSTDAIVEDAIAKKKIVRTWAMRGTLHFVSSSDIHWLTDLLAPKIISSAGSRYRQLGLDAKVLQKSLNIFSTSLNGNDQLTRKEIALLLGNEKIPTNENRLSHILQFSVLNKLICFGPRRGKEFTFTLLDEWISKQKKIVPREQSLAEITKRYFTSRGPATVKDFIWWSGLSVADAKAGVEMIHNSLTCEKINGQEYYFSKELDLSGFKNLKGLKKRVFLLAAYDEYLIAYADRSICLDPKFNTKAIYNNGIIHPTIVIDGQIVGIWRPIPKNNSITMRSELFIKLSKVQQTQVDKEFEKHCRFIKIK